MPTFTYTQTLQRAPPRKVSEEEVERAEAICLATVQGMLDRARDAGAGVPLTPETLSQILQMCEAALLAEGLDLGVRASILRESRTVDLVVLG